MACVALSVTLITVLLLISLSETDELERPLLSATIAFISSDDTSWMTSLIEMICQILVVRPDVFSKIDRIYMRAVTLYATKITFAGTLLGPFNSDNR